MQPTEQQGAAEQPRKLSLFELVEQGQQLLAELDDADGELTPELAQRLDALMGSIETKAEVYKALYLSFSGEAEACERLASVYTQRAAQKRRRAESLKTRLFDAMQSLNCKKVGGPTGGARIQANGAASLELALAEEELVKKLPDELVEVRRVLRKDEIKKRLAAGESVPHATLKRGEHLRWF